MIRRISIVAMLVAGLSVPSMVRGEQQSTGQEAAAAPNAPDEQTANEETATDCRACGGVRVSDVSFYVFAALAVISCLGVVFSTNIVRSAMWLLGTLGSVAFLFFLLMANFLAVIQLIVYAGGILVLIVFGIMLTSKSPYVRMNARKGEIIGGSAVCVVLFLLLVQVLTSVSWPESPDAGAEVIPVAQLGQGLLTTYLVPFEVVSVLLMVVMIGAAYLVRAEK